MFEERTKASKFNDEFPEADLTDFYKNRRNEDSLSAVWVVMGFYQRLAIAVEYGRIHKDLFVKLFGQMFTWWYIVSFDHNMDEVWAGTRPIRGLWKTIVESASDKQVTEWKVYAFRDLDDIKGKRATRAPAPTHKTHSNTVERPS